MTQAKDAAEGGDIWCLSGIVKWYDPVKGFGFVISDEDGRDILLHANVLREFGPSALMEGARLKLCVQQTDRGLQATEIQSLSAPETRPLSGLSDFESLDPEELAALPLVPARIKWFDKGKGFGFANVFGRDEDIFVHIEVLRSAGLGTVQQGEAVALRVLDGRRGKMAAEVVAWELVSDLS